MRSAVPAQARQGCRALQRVFRGMEMSFGNLYFVFGFLPVSLLLYFIAPHRAKNTVLLL